MQNVLRVIRRALAVLLVALFYHQTCLGQADPWERVKLVEPGKNVHVKLHSGKTVKGRMDAWTPQGLTLRQGKDKAVTLAQSDVAHVAMVAGMSRGKRAGYAGLIGGAVGGGLVGASCAADGDCDVSAVALAAAGALFIGGIAAGIAALIPRHKETLYTAKPAPAN